MASQNQGIPIWKTRLLAHPHIYALGLIGEQNLDRLPLQRLPAEARYNICKSGLDALVNAQEGSFSRELHIQWALDIMAHSLLLPARYSDLCSTCVGFYCDILNQKEKAAIFDGFITQPEKYYPTLIAQLSLVFLFRDTQDVYDAHEVPRGESCGSQQANQYIAQHLDICKRVLTELSSLVKRMLSSGEIFNSVGGYDTLDMTVRVICGVADYASYIQCVYMKQPLRPDADAFFQQMQNNALASFYELQFTCNSVNKSSIWALFWHFSQSQIVAYNCRPALAQFRVACLGLVQNLIGKLYGAGAENAAQGSLRFSWIGSSAPTDFGAEFNDPVVQLRTLQRLLWGAGRLTDIRSTSFCTEMVGVYDDLVSPFLQLGSTLHFIVKRSANHSPSSPPQEPFNYFVPDSETLLRLFGDQLLGLCLKYTPPKEKALRQAEALLNQRRMSDTDTKVGREQIKAAMFSFGEPVSLALSILLRIVLRQESRRPRCDTRHYSATVLVLSRAASCGDPRVVDVVLTYAYRMFQTCSPAVYKVPGLLTDCAFAATRAIAVAASVQESQLPPVPGIPLTYVGRTAVPRGSALSGAIRFLAAALPIIKADGESDPLLNRVCETLRLSLSSLWRNGLPPNGAFSLQDARALLALAAQLLRLSGSVELAADLVLAMARFIQWINPDAAGSATGVQSIQSTSHHELVYQTLDQLWSVRDMFVVIEQSSPGTVSQVLSTLCEPVYTLLNRMTSVMSTPMNAGHQGQGPAEEFAQDELHATLQSGGAIFMSSVVGLVLRLAGYLAHVMPCESGIFWSQYNMSAAREQHTRGTDSREACTLSERRNSAFKILVALISFIRDLKGVQPNTLGSELSAHMLTFYYQVLHYAGAVPTHFPHAVQQSRLSPEVAARLSKDGYNAESDSFTDVAFQFFGSRLRPVISPGAGTPFDRLGLLDARQDVSVGVVGGSIVTTMATGFSRLTVVSRQVGGVFAWNLDFVPITRCAEQNLRKTIAVSAAWRPEDTSTPMIYRGVRYGCGEPQATDLGNGPAVAPPAPLCHLASLLVGTDFGTQSGDFAEEVETDLGDIIHNVTSKARAIASRLLVVPCDPAVLQPSYVNTVNDANHQLGSGNRLAVAQPLVRNCVATQHTLCSSLNYPSPLGLFSSLFLTKASRGTPPFFTHLSSDVVSLFSTKLGRVDSDATRIESKVGLLYAAQGQYTQGACFHNQGGSQLYRSFVSSMGRTVRRADHVGWNGKLDCGEYLVINFDETQTLAFHDPCLIENEANDEQQVTKKRHVGNDNVVCVWSEQERAYKADTVSSQLLNRVFTVRPLCGPDIANPTAANLFLISVFVKPTNLTSPVMSTFSQDENTPFSLGIVVDGMTVSGDNLSSVVTNTLISAVNRWRLGSGEPHPLTVRASHFADIISSNSH